MPGNDRGLFDAPVLSPVVWFFGGESFMKVADLAGDGALDVVWIDAGPFARVMLGNGNSTFGPERRYHIGASPASPIEVIDLDRDGGLDVFVTTHPTPAVLLHR